MGDGGKPDATGKALRLVTWNLNHWRQPLLPTDTRRAAWEFLAQPLGAQVVLVQEAVPPLDLVRDRAVYGELAGHRNWGSAVVALDPVVSIEPLRSVRIPYSRRRYLLTNTHPGTEFGVAELRGRSLADRSRALVAIAHPDFRSDLAAAARRRWLV